MGLQRERVCEHTVGMSHLIAAIIPIFINRALFKNPVLHTRQQIKNQQNIKSLNKVKSATTKEKTHTR